MLSVGSQMPEFVVRDTERQKVSNQDFENTVTVIAFYPMAFTGGWTIEMQEFQELISQFEALDAKVVGVSADTFASQGAFAQQNGFTFPLLSDWPNLAMMDAFGVKNEPGTSAVRSTFIFGTDSILHEVIADQDASDHAPLALEAIKALSN